ncbi:TPA: LamG domain-containing protein [Candidatus Poribacteria bacterium]|nr:LamG domain-containing protein [Candidatus Poribacteria bacterium]
MTSKDISNIGLLAFIATIFIVFLTTAAFAKIDPETIVGMWLFNEKSGDIAKDSSERGNDGKLEGGYKWVDGKFRGGLELDGATGHVTVESNDSLILEEFTIVSWANLESSKGTRWQSIMMKGQNPRNYLLCVDKDTQRLQLSITKGAKGAWGGPIQGPVVTDGDWHHLAGLAGEKEGLVIYVDGIEVGKQPYAKPSLDADPSRMRIGDGSAGGHQCKGILDEVGLFNAPLSETEINNIMNNGLEQFVQDVAPAGKLATTWASLKEKR